jgi:enamine deaminase RidA (YjgF/YER057c/UK114 family)
MTTQTQTPVQKGNTAMSYDAKLRELGYSIQTVELNAGRLMHAVRTGNLVYTSGQVSRHGDQQVVGKVGRDLTVEEGYEGARLAALGCLQAVYSLLGSLDQVVRVVKVLGMVNVAPDFTNTPAVIHGASDLFIEVFGEAGRHARSAVGMQIPSDFAVEVEAIFEVK